MRSNKGFTPTPIEDQASLKRISLLKGMHLLSKLIMKKKKDGKSNLQLVSGFTLIELIISFSIFIVLITLTTATFAQTLRTQRIVGDLSVSMNEVSFVTEQMAREMRTGTNFSVAGEEAIQFTNANNEMVSYKKVGNGIARCVGACGADSDYKPLTPPDVKISTLKFILMGDGRANGAWRVTIITAVQDPKDINVNLETTISARVIGK